MQDNFHIEKGDSGGLSGWSENRFVAKIKCCTAIKNFVFVK